MKLLRNKTSAEKSVVPGIVVDIALRSCIFLLQVNSPLRTMCSLCDLLTRSGAEVILLQIKAEGAGDASLIIQLRVRRNTIKTLTESISKITGVLQIDWIER